MQSRQHGRKARFARLRKEHTRPLPSRCYIGEVKVFLFSTKMRRKHMSWFLLEIDEVFKTLSTSFDGIAEAEAEKRLAEYGPNKLEEGKKKTLIMMFLGQ